jgi:RNase adapter protein RapZ
MIERIPLKKTCSQYQVLIVTGLSGAGKTSIMRSLEDIGFYCVDNLPVPLLTTFLKLVCHNQTNFAKVALGIDARGEQFLSNFINAIDTIKKEAADYKLNIIFANAHEQTLLKRFQETRRKHPLSSNVSIEQAIEKEKKLMAPIMAMSDVILDTDTLNIHGLRHVIRTQFANDQQCELTVNIISFGFKYGVPAESNLVYDLRFLPNPHFVPELKEFDGRNQIIHDYLFEHNIVHDYWNRMTDFLHYVLVQFHEEGRFFVTVAIGCTGGKHRSVAFAQKLHNQSWQHIRFLITHRDIGKE